MMMCNISRAYVHYYRIRIRNMLLLYDALQHFRLFQALRPVAFLC